MSDKFFANDIIDLAYGNAPCTDNGVFVDSAGDVLMARKAQFADALRALYERHGKRPGYTARARLQGVARGQPDIGVTVLDALDAGITKLEIQAVARLCFTPEGNR